VDSADKAAAANLPERSETRDKRERELCRWSSLGAVVNGEAPGDESVGMQLPCRDDRLGACGCWILEDVSISEATTV
jgi:hypothetical protein